MTNTAARLSRACIHCRAPGISRWIWIRLDSIREHQPSVILLTSPNNPTGTALPVDDIRAILDAAPGVVVVDEAYAEFRRHGVPSAVTLLPEHPGSSSPAR